jgi:hypothetical protein
MIDYKHRADECRRLAELRAGSEHWAAFLEMAETWDKLSNLHEQSQKLISSGALLKAPPGAHAKISAALLWSDKRESMSPSLVDLQAVSPKGCELPT